jgi:hypothetical protein
MNKGNTSVEGVLAIIKDQVENGVTRKDCHGMVADAIIKGVATAEDYICLLGTGETVFHSIIVSKDRKILVDSFYNSLSDYDISSGMFVYHIKKYGAEFTFETIKKVKVRNL